MYFFLSDATVYVGGLDEKVSEPLLWELFLQAGPVVNTHMPKDRVTGQHQGKCLPLPCNKVNVDIFKSQLMDGWRKFKVLTVVFLLRIRFRGVPQ